MATTRTGRARAFLAGAGAAGRVATARLRRAGARRVATTAAAGALLRRRGGRLARTITITLQALLRAEVLLGFLGAAVTHQCRLIKNAIDELGVRIAAVVRIGAGDAEDASSNLSAIGLERLAVILTRDLNQVSTLFLVHALVAAAELGANAVGGDQFVLRKFLQLVELDNSAVKNSQDVGFGFLLLVSKLKDNTDK